MAKDQVPSDTTNEQQRKATIKYPFESILGQVVGKIKNEPFLFVIGVIALLVGLATLATQIGSSDFRIIVIVIAALSFIVIVGYYLRDGLTPTTAKEQEPIISRIFDESKTFLNLSTFSQKKEFLIHPFQARIESGTLVLTEEQQRGCAASPWDFDRVVLYLFEEHSKSTKFNERFQHVIQEWEKLRASEGRRSLIPLHYAIRTTLRFVEQLKEPSKETQPSLPLFHEILEYLKARPEIDQGSEVKTNITSIIHILQKRKK
jgi:hypothetical protein